MRRPNSEKEMVKMDDNETVKNKEEIKCPENVPEEAKGMTDAEVEWAKKKKEQRPPLPKWIFAAIAAIVVLAFLGGSIWYYRTSVLPEKYFQRAEAFFHDENYPGAYVLYERVYEIRPERKGVLYKIGFCLEKMGRYDGAIRRYQQHLKKMPGDGQAMLRLGWLLANMRGDGEQGMEYIRRGAKKLDDPYAWTMLGTAAKKYASRDVEIEALVKQTELFKEPEKVITCSRMLARLGAWREALDGYSSAAKLAPDNIDVKHGIVSARQMLGLPADERFLIVPGKSLGLIKIDASKEEVKEAVGAPDFKQFTVVGGKSMMADEHVEIWLYMDSMPKRNARVIFLRGRVREIETASPAYRTDAGLGISNFMLEKNKGKLKSVREARNSTMLYLVKGGGLTFYAYGFNENNTDAKYKKLRVHKGDISIDNVDGFSLLDLFH